MRIFCLLDCFDGKKMKLRFGFLDKRGEMGIKYKYLYIYINIYKILGSVRKKMIFNGFLIQDELAWLQICPNDSSVGATVL